MSEVENHYAGVGGTTGRGPVRQPGASRGVRGAVEGATGAVRDTYDRAADWAEDGVRSASRTLSSAQKRSSDGFGQVRGSVETFVAENPVMVGVVGLAAGLLLGSLLPSTRRENQVFGRYADEVKDQGRRYARELAEQGKAYVEESLESVKSQAAEASTQRTA